MNEWTNEQIKYTKKERKEFHVTTDHLADFVKKKIICCTADKTLSTTEQVLPLENVIYVINYTWQSSSKRYKKSIQFLWQLNICNLSITSYLQVKKFVLHVSASAAN